ncbi:MAG: twin-arginine translocation signal domain-containing protein [Acidobacteriota bacterium]
MTFDTRTWDRRSFLKAAGVAAALPSVSSPQPAPQRPGAQRPFFPIREAIICPTGRSEQLTEFAWVNFETWPEERIRRYPAFLKACGFNSIQVTEIRGYCGKRKTQDLTNVARVVRVLAEEARRQDMSVSQFIWGLCLLHEGDSLCWNDRRERKWMEGEFTRLARTYARLVDHIVLHYSDPGGCNRNGCDAYKTPQEISQAVLKAYRKENPAVRATISAWANKSFFDGHPGMGKLLDETFSPKEFAIALHRWYDPERARLVKDTGRKVGIWSWYIADYEMAHDCAFCMKVLDKYFSSLPAEASVNVDWISMERCWHGMPSDINLWVAGQKLIDPFKPLQKIEEDFCTAVFGRAGPAALQAYHACEDGQVDQRIYGYFIPETDRYPALTATPEFEKQAREALRALESVSTPLTTPQIPLVTQPEDMVVFLKNRLKLLLSYGQALRSGSKTIEAVESDPLYWSLQQKLAGTKPS